MSDAKTRKVFVTGGTGYLGRYLIPELVWRGHAVATLVRPGSESRVPAAVRFFLGDALDKSTFKDHIKPADTFVQLVGVPHPSPAKAAEFRRVDLVSVRESVAAAVEAGIRHFIYLSVAQPAPVMRAYLAVRAEGESLIRQSGMNATFLRPLYILGPGHRWPKVLMPFFRFCTRIPSMRASAERLMPVHYQQTIQALVDSVENPPTGTRIMESPEIRRYARA